MQLWNNRGLIYSFFLGIATPYLFITLLGWFAAYVQIPLYAYLVREYAFDVKTTIYTVNYGLDTILAIFVAFVIAYPLGLLGKGGIYFKIGIYIFAFYIGFQLPVSEGYYLENLLFILTTPSLVIYILFSIIFMYMANKRNGNVLGINNEKYA